MRVYLCGPINGCTDDEACTWREWFKNVTKSNVAVSFQSATFVDPMVRDYRGKEQDGYREIVDLDKRDLRSCGAVVVMFTAPSVGTSMEIYDAWLHAIPVVVIDESGKPLSPWLVYHSTVIVNSKDEAAAKLREWMRVCK